MAGKPYRIGLYEKAMPDSLSLLQRLSVAAETGYDYLELSIDESDARLSRLDWSEAQRREAKLMLADAPVGIGSVCLSAHRRFPLGSRDAGIRDRSIDILRRAVDLAGCLGIPVIQLAGYDVYYEDSGADTRAWFIDGLARCVEIASCAGVLLAFETMETPFMNTVSKAMEYVHLIDSPYLHVYPDLGNIVNASLVGGVSAAEDLLSGRGHIAAVHIKESLPSVYREVPYGKGHVDMHGLLTVCWELGVRRYVTEFWHSSATDWHRQIIESKAHVDGQFFNGVDNR